MGQLGWSIREYYTSSPHEFEAACEGYYDKYEDQAQLFRLSAYRIHQSLVEKPLPIHKFWPLRGDRVATKNKVFDADMLEKIKKLHNIK